jgi:heavy metal translocating P-type ATPase
MILETLILGSVLYAGYKELKKSFKKNKSFLPANQNGKKPQNVIENQITRFFGVKSDKNQKKLSQQENELMSAAIAVTVSTAGLYYHFISPLSLPFILYATQDVYKITFFQAKQGKITANTLTAITLIGIAMTGRFFMASLIAFLVQLASQATTKTAEISKKQLFDLFEQPIDFVWIIVDGVEVRIPFDELQIGDIVIVHAGELIPADGVILKGMASVDEQILTGEAIPREKKPGDEVFASTVMLSGQITLKVEKIGEASTVAQIAHILNHTVNFNSTTQLQAEMLSEQLVKPMVIAGSLAWSILGFESALAVLNAHPKNEIMILAPVSMMNHLNLASRQGILIKEGRCLELLSQVDTIVFEKTGTLTEEQPQVGAIYCCSHYNEHQILAYAAAAEYKQTHPVARAIQQEAENRQLENIPINKSEYKIGYGLIVDVAGITIHVGSYRLLETENILIPASIKQQQQFSHEAGYTLILVAVEHEVIGAIELLPIVRSEAKSVIRRLKQRPHIKSIYMISGDHEVPTEKLAQALGIDSYFAETLPVNKVDIIEQLQQQGHFICYIGDGINDSMALKKSQVSVSMCGTPTIAADTAQIVLLGQDLNHLNLLFNLADDFNANINTTVGILLTPAVIGISGVFLFGFGVSHTVALNMAGLALGLGNTMLPLLKKPEKSGYFESESESAPFGENQSAKAGSEVFFLDV